MQYTDLIAIIYDRVTFTGLKFSNLFGAMASAAFTTGEERLDYLIRMVPVKYPNSHLIVDGLSVLTAVMLSDPQCCSLIGVSDVLRYKLEEIRSVRQSREDIDDVDVGIIYDFYYDVMRCYAGAERRELTEGEFKKMSSFNPDTSLRGVVDGEFHKLHDAVATLGLFFLPPVWRSTGMTQFRVITEFDVAQMQRYCYLHLFKPQYSHQAASVLGPRPTLGAVLSLLSPQACRSTDEFDRLYVVRKENNDLHITHRTPLGVHLYVNDLLEFRDDEDCRYSGLLSIFDRVGASDTATSHDGMFQQAMDDLADVANSASDAQSHESGCYKLASVDFNVPAVSFEFPDGSQSLRLKFNSGYLTSFVKTWSTNTRAEGLAIALREYNDRVLNLDVVSRGLGILRSEGLLNRCRSKWRMEVAELVSISKSDADYWFAVADELADGFREIHDSPIPIWLEECFDRKSKEFASEARKSIEKAHHRPTCSAKPETYLAELGFRHSRRTSDSSANSKSTGSSDSDRGFARAKRTSLPAECRIRYEKLMNGPEHKIPGFQARMSAIHLFRMAGNKCFLKYKKNYVRELVLREYNITKI